MLLVPAARRQAASKLGHACCEQSGPKARISSRSPLARATGTLASTWGAKPGRTVRAVAANAATAIAESALIRRSPVRAFAARPFVNLSYEAAVSGCLRDRQEMVSSRRLLFRPRKRTKQVGIDKTAQGLQRFRQWVKYSGGCRSLQG